MLITDVDAKRVVPPFRVKQITVTETSAANYEVSLFPWECFVPNINMYSIKDTAVSDLLYVVPIVNYLNLHSMVLFNTV